MWLVSGVDEEQRFLQWTEAVDCYRRMVGDWVGAHGGDGAAAPAVDRLVIGCPHRAVFDDPRDGTVEFRMRWETPVVRPVAALPTASARYAGGGRVPRPREPRHDRTQAPAR